MNNSVMIKSDNPKFIHFVTYGLLYTICISVIMLGILYLFEGTSWYMFNDQPFKSIAALVFIAMLLVSITIIIDNVKFSNVTFFFEENKIIFLKGKRNKHQELTSNIVDINYGFKSYNLFGYDKIIFEFKTSKKNKKKHFGIFIKHRRVNHVYQYIIEQIE